MSNNSGHSNLAKFAFNIYGTLNNSSSLDNSSNHSPPSSSSSTRSKIGYLRSSVADNLTYNCEREVNCLTELEFVNNSGFINNVVIGGKNYLKLLMLNADQTSILNEANVLEALSNPASRLPGSNKLHNFNTIKSYSNTIAGGMVNGSLTLFQVQNNGKSRAMKRLTDHTRCINSLDFLDPSNSDMSSNFLISGSQDGSIKLWDLRQSNNKPSVNIVPKSNYDSVRSCQFSNHSLVKNKLVILSVHDSGTLNKYDLRSIHQSTQSSVVPERKWNFHTGPALSLNIHPEKEYVITCGRDQKVCVWNYGENQNNYSNTSPEHVINTYGPVMKVRWCPYSNPSKNNDEDVLYDDRDLNTSNNPLFKYDFACSYLNEDPTITVFNLKRKYIPKEIVTSNSKRPYLNFIWANNLNGKRRLWTLTKGNQFMSRCLDSFSEYDNITRPKELLNPVSQAWGTSIGDISFINQEENEFENTEPLEKMSSEAFFDTIYDSEVDTNEANDPNDYNKVIIGSYQSSFNSPPNSSLATSPIEQAPHSRPALFRSATYNNAGFPAKATSSSPQLRNSLSSYNIYDSPLSRRPTMGRNPSQTTIDSNPSMGSPVNRSDFNPDTKRAISIHYASPYIVPVSLALPLNDDIVFETLSNNYILTIPDGFSLVDVCLLNASVAGSVNRFRDCQIWRMLAVGLGQHVDGVLNDDAVDVNHYSNGDTATEPDDNNDNKSILSDYGNFIGSYNSNSTSTTHYGGSESTSEKRSANPRSWSETKNSSSNNLLDMINQNRNNSIVNAISISPKGNERFKQYSPSPKNLSLLSRTKPKRGSSFTQASKEQDMDLDNENLNVMNNAISSSFSSSAMSAAHTPDNRSTYGSNNYVGSFKSRRSSSIAPTYGFSKNRTFDQGLPEVDEVISNHSSRMGDSFKESGLTRAIEGIKEKPKDSNYLEVPWTITKLLQKALEHATLQGDVIFCSTLCLLFFPFTKSLGLRFLKNNYCLEWLSLYIEILQKKRLYVNAMNILNDSPRELQEKLLTLYHTDTLKLYCQNCNSLIVNEEAKMKFNQGNTKVFGYWYCEQCKSKQSNCVYCNEPCQGLNVVVSLNCGHRGHFGCLREWFVDGQNLECPGGCNELLF
ncbi:hypothetical protein CANTEDRAFT_126525 [Yamadazyma tenuis ATCC 10573]|uniref:Restriction of telomere capping protein 1 n=1 Tax=Candida tenuis (strain ATCC 10573 / BCRC 21748 / CBS 615 / JCM 9827 / NBRC 10315 / NRRL Y-1498 / VKM Y-70) TaxID=590646 RepID=G3B9D3_CANTC|nr:uncharacterized protein CANTEDRAFT_126525 [Yamadazyma tenuis ATCC 10573]EGV62477.1 hypothetical protein CANTEDRAFT_126525 [Yamadazyma tenuis ATCC 10573]